MEWLESYQPDYFCIDDILATQERIPCKVELPIYSLGYLDQSSGSENLEVGTKLELPCWLAHALSSRRRIVSTQLPSVFNEKYREILRADPTVVNLHKLGPYFYESGLHSLPLAGESRTDLSSILGQTLRERLRNIMDSSLNALEEDNASQIALLDELERTLFKVGQLSLRDHELWLSRRSHLLKASSMIERNNKRKFSELS